MATWWITPDVTNSSIESKQHPVFPRRGGYDDRIGPPAKVLINDRVHLMPLVPQMLGEVMG